MTIFSGFPYQVFRANADFTITQTRALDGSFIIMEQIAADIGETRGCHSETMDEKDQNTEDSHRPKSLAEHVTCASTRLRSHAEGEPLSETTRRN
jgi:hypothetical protein